MPPRNAIALLIVATLTGPAPSVLAVDCNNNGIDDACDLACDLACGPPAGPCHVPGCGTSPDCNANETPDVCDVVRQVSVPAEACVYFAGRNQGDLECAYPPDPN